MTETFINVSIRCGPDAKRKIAEFADWGVIAEAFLFVCKDCGARWNLHEFSGAHHPDKISCSNCYGDHVLIAQIRQQDIRKEIKMEDS